jgi:prefoldin subunit 5
MRRAADSREGGDIAEAQSALDRLQEARRMLDRGRTERLDRDVQDALRRAERLGEQQDQMTEDVEDLGADGGRPSAEAMSRIMERKDELQREVSELEGDLDRMAREWRDEQREAAQELGEAAQSIRDNRLADKIRYSKGVVQQRTPEYARNFEEQIGADIEELRQRLERAAGAVGEDEGQRVDELLEDTRDLVQGLESLDERIQSQADRLQRGEQGQQGEQQQGGQQGEQQQGARANKARANRAVGRAGKRGARPDNRARVVVTPPGPHEAASAASIQATCVSTVGNSGSGSANWKSCARVSHRKGSTSGR